MICWGEMNYKTYKDLLLKLLNKISFTNPYRFKEVFTHQQKLFWIAV